jgi:hypothetical protein
VDAHQLFVGGHLARLRAPYKLALRFSRAPLAIGLITRFIARDSARTSLRAQIRPSASIQASAGAILLDLGPSSADQDLSRLLWLYLWDVRH